MGLLILVIVLCCFALGIRHPWKWFMESSMRGQRAEPEAGMTKETLGRLQQMSREEKERRFRDLLHKHNIAPVPAPLQPGGPPIEIPLEEAEEREWLKKDLGYK